MSNSNNMDKIKIELLTLQRDRLLEALKLHKKFWDEMPKGQLGNIVCNIGILNQAFIKTDLAIAKVERK